MTQYGTKWHQTAFIGHKELFKKLQRGSRNLQCKLFENHRKSPTTLRAKRATFTFWVDKSYLKMPKLVKLASFWKTKVCGQTMLPDRSVLMNQELLENAKIHKFKCDIL